MRHLTVVGGVDRAILLKRLAMGVSAFFAGRTAKCMSKPVAALTAHRNANVAKSKSTTPEWACRSGTNAVETPVDAGVLILPRINRAATLLQSASRLVACVTVAWKRRGAPRGIPNLVLPSKAGVVGNEPGMRPLDVHLSHVVPLALRKLLKANVRWLVLFTACFIVNANTHAQNPAPTNCKQYGGTNVCIPSTNVYYQAQEQTGVRSFIITFDVYVILNTFEKYDNKRPEPICFLINNMI